MDWHKPPAPKLINSTHPATFQERLDEHVVALRQAGWDQPTFQFDASPTQGGSIMYAVLVSAR